MGGNLGMPSIRGSFFISAIQRVQDADIRDASLGANVLVTSAELDTVRRSESPARGTTPRMTVAITTLDLARPLIRVPTLP